MRRKKNTKDCVLTVKTLIRAIRNDFSTVFVIQDGKKDIILDDIDFFRFYDDQIVKAFTIDTENDILAIWIEGR